MDNRTTRTRYALRVSPATKERNEKLKRINKERASLKEKLKGITSEIESLHKTVQSKTYTSKTGRKTTANKDDAKTVKGLKDKIKKLYDSRDKVTEKLFKLDMKSVSV